ncbi:hypothetical protein A3F57_03175 [Candidatus Roizmanbacteria bacterium RIFCSPHIGHO2_12_FULL_36_11]|uniref:DNA (cytosine-5-)-methyltransferase n=1 Tax=Candidatus Curtissbacteria bacterium RIFCSPLOWO2_01_FULL_37_9 TaxID=1797724 RepID=A0A1F5GUF7_9BACT|nr:MAG: hypothetical protein A3A48_03670 [Candidatus Curtissbacteria bacterium RIFCSPLOWO2_01_FULL_37_9]OGK32580.1 MAG: hypothetical protein A3F57_03175 [Candidatus Roizmanbacteria bacterium RIFCSPHIGHO2_12_FULL_36_11]
MKNAKPKVVELFSGCGGTSTGFEMAGFEVILGADIHKPSIDTFHYNHKSSTTILGDLTNITEKDLLKALPVKMIDVMIAGVPCQGFSLNNRKRHAKDRRNFLFKEYLRFVNFFQPPIAILENVSGMRSTADGAFVEDIENEFRKAGYETIEHRMLNSADYGVPQIRMRLVFIATKKGIKFEWPNKIYSEKGKKHYLTVRDAISDLPTLHSGESSSEYDKLPQNKYQKLMRNMTNKLENHKAPSHPESTIKKIGSTKQGEPMYPKFKQRIRLSWSKPSPTQVSGGIRPQFQFGHPNQARGLTVRERCRIQSFPDDFVVFGGTVQGRVQTGNAVPPLLAKAIAEEVKKAFKKSKYNG